MGNVKNVGPKEALNLTRKGALLVDVREPRELAGMAYEVQEVLNLPMSKFGQRYQEIPKNRQVIVACNSGSRSASACRILMNQGYRKVVNLQGGIIRWRREGLPVVTGEKKSLLSRIMAMFGKAS
jgi:rhodanese-related sulfurtransferase